MYNITNILRGDIMFRIIKIKKLPVFAAVTSLIIAAAAFAGSSRAEESSVGTRVPIIMYHSISRDESRSGEYVVTPQVFEEDILYLKNKGYEPITVNELILSRRCGTQLPEKPVIITLDDGHLNALTQALPIIRRHGFKMTVSVVGSFAEAAGEQAEPDENTDYCDYKDIAALRKSGICEIACHSYDMHSLDERKGVLRLDSESFESYREVFLRDILKAQKGLESSCDFKANIFCYPYGFYDSASEKVIKSAGFEAALTCEERVNIIDDDTDLYRLGRFNRPLRRIERGVF